MLKQIFLGLLILLIGVLSFLTFEYYPKLGIGAAYAAKKMCSCTFISERSQESIQGEDLAMSPLNLTKSTIDWKKKSVTSSFFGLNAKTAEYRGKLGCVLLIGKDDFQIQFSDTTIKENILAEIDFPYGDRIQKHDVKGVDYSKLAIAAEQAFDPDGGMTSKKTRSLLILHKDTLLLERYAKGYDADTEILGWSMTKSIINAWVGMMIKDSIIHLEDTVLFEEWKNDERKDISLNDLLHMSSGLEWQEVYSDISPATQMLYNSENNSAIARKQPLEYFPGSKWQYSSGTTNIISGYLRNQFKNHDDYLSYPYKRIFTKLNMDNTVLETDESGTYIGSSYCYATTRDWARFGTLFLRDGVWNGERLLPEGWVNYSKTPAPASNGIYGAHFWTNSGDKYYKDAPADMYSANGYEGQRIFIIPSKDLVIVRLGLNQDFDFNGLVRDICESIEN